jgi:hypothetical protein
MDFTEWLNTLPDDQTTEITDDHDGVYHCADCAGV